ncbi:penicillin-binding protein 2 [Ktedonosporobacter rubrisoli]|uniref:Penicillin-binding protein 2 n=1 Tax=Ktedonosporobacter rubrisoli TaxID=2509675 RepID=A0A4P6JVF1_KTERU|nr:penicillin-binding protein 2 [Ktedonosporobacter rubrisoli]QBD79637.1 penicillin-binding protein 2 [Ktedonosporobacter rubrisoli]
MDISSSIRKLSLLFMALFMALSGGIVYWQVVAGPQVAANPHNGRRCLNNVAPVRGRIFDRNGVLLAESKPAPGVCGYLRHYTEPSLAGLIGYYISPLYPATGIENAFDDYLSGRRGATQIDNTLNQLLHRPPVGDDLYLTIDVRIQRIVDQHFDDPLPAGIDNVNTFATQNGSVVVTNPHTGEILAMLSRPGYDPNKLVSTVAAGKLDYYNQLASDKNQPLLERPLQAAYVPGSTYKAMTLLAALDSHTTTLDQQFDQFHAKGPIKLGEHMVGPDHNLDGYTVRFPVNTEYGFAHSDNVIFAQLGVNTGVDTWLEYNKRFYVGQKLPFDLPVQTSTVTKDGQLDVNTLADNSFGQGVDLITPLQMSLIQNIIANNGQLMQPTIISKITDQNKTPEMVTKPQPLGSQQVSNQAATDARRAMYGVAHCGSGLPARVTLAASPWGIIGKTGTGEIGGGQPAQAWLITAAPYSVTQPDQLPALTIVAMKEHGGDGGASTGPMISAMYNDIFTNVMKLQQPEPINPRYCCSEQLLQLGC